MMMANNQYSSSAMKYCYLITWSRKAHVSDTCVVGRFIFCVIGNCTLRFHKQHILFDLVGCYYLISWIFLKRSYGLPLNNFVRYGRRRPNIVHNPQWQRLISLSFASSLNFPDAFYVIVNYCRVELLSYDSVELLPRWDIALMLIK